MKIVLNTNIYFSLMKPDSSASHLFSFLNTEFIAPTQLKSELNRHKEECLLKSGLSRQEFDMRMDAIEAKINFHEVSKYRKFLQRAIKELFDPEDSPFVALALSIGALVWSNDPHLKKQKLVEVFSTKELIDKMIKDEI
ncbi:hypothetical protein JXA85_08770 [Candidatus Woesearchaeota archaeon]|nr:hypothetical protein [Candidatus Woesearchaeota archaeon]